MQEVCSQHDLPNACYQSTWYTTDMPENELKPIQGDSPEIGASTSGQSPPTDRRFMKVFTVSEVIKDWRCSFTTQKVRSIPQASNLLHQMSPSTIRCDTNIEFM